MNADDDMALEMLIEFLNAIEAGIASAKQRLKQEKGLGEERISSWNPGNMNWTEAQGNSGTYQRSEDLDSQDFNEMLKDLAAHQGKLSKDGYFYWLFKSGSTVGRKERKP